MAKIKVIDVVHCKADKGARALILPALQYKNIVWKKSFYGGRQIEEKVQYLITGRKGTGGTFLTGLLPRIEEYIKKEKLKIKITGQENLEIIKPTKEAQLKGITFRPDQKKVLKKVKKESRGIFLFPTGTGKTLLAAGIISMFPKNKILFLCNTTDLIEQAKVEFSRFFKAKNIFVFGNKQRADWGKIKSCENPIVISTIQSFAKFERKIYIDFFDITIGDESDLINEEKSQYGKVMLSNLSPRRYGFTATLPSKHKKLLCNEGFFGKVIGNLSMKQGIKKNILAKPEIKLLPVEYEVNVRQGCKNYYDYYSKGIIENKTRNKLIVKEVIKNMKENKSTLIIIENTLHGKILKKMFSKEKIKCPFIYGHTEKEKRNKTKQRLQNKKILVTVCSKIWKRGINIPTLNNIINACGMKEENAVIQAMGRGMRTAKGKDTVLLTDFLDPYKYLAEHSILRIQTYVKMGWI